MARTINAGGTQVLRRDVFLIDPDEVVIEPEFNGRSKAINHAAVIKYAKDFIDPAIGQIHAIDCRETHDKRAAVTAGFTRLAAAILVKHGSPENGIEAIPTFKIACTINKCSEQDGFLRNVIENKQRHATSAIDDAQNFRKLRNYGFSDERISSAMNAKISWLEKLEGLLALDNATQDRIHEGQISIADALELVALSPAERKTVLDDAKAAAKAKVAPESQPEAAKAAVEAAAKVIDKAIGGSAASQAAADAEIKASEIDKKTLKSKLREKRAEKGKSNNRPLKEQRKDWESLKKDETGNNDAIATFADIYLGYLKGRRNFESVCEAIYNVAKKKK